MTVKRLGACAMVAAVALSTAPAQGQTIAELQRQIDELKATVRQLQEVQRQAAAPVSSAPTGTTPPPAPVIAQATAPVDKPQAFAEVPPTPVPTSGKGKRLRLRGYTQMRVNEIVAGDATAPAGRARLRSVHDGGISDRGNFTFRRIRLVLEGNVTDNVAVYLQPDFATRIGNQSVGEPREGSGQIRDAYVDWFPDKAHRFRLRFGQSKVPFGWENMQSSSNRVPLDRSDGINSAVPSEREIGIVGYYTPAHVQRIWDRLSKDGQKLFGNFGAFGVGAFNGQGVNRAEANNGLMTVAMASWPFELDALGPSFAGQVVEIGAAGLRNRVQPEVRSGGTSAVAFADDRVGFHAILYPQPFGIQSEWNWGRGPQWDPVRNTIATRPLTGGYVQTMLRVERSPIGGFIPYARWQYYHGGWKAALDAPELRTREWEVGVEFQPTPPLELTLAYAHMKRREADTRREGEAEGDVLRAQLQWNY